LLPLEVGAPNTTVAGTVRENPKDGLKYIWYPAADVFDGLLAGRRRVRERGKAIAPSSPRQGLGWGGRKKDARVSVRDWAFPGPISNVAGIRCAREADSL